MIVVVVMTAAKAKVAVISIIQGHCVVTLTIINKVTILSVSMIAQMAS